MQISNLEEIRKKVEEISLKLPQKIDINSYITFGNQEDFAKPNIEIDNSLFYNFIVVERGQELEKRITINLDDLLYWIFELITFDLASKFELQNRIENSDFRKILFKKQEELLSFISDYWKAKKLIEHNEILKIFPFQDKK
ncbi:Imm63 family immunity protein [Chryseobacterium sp. R2A-55]|uniref:Imm63 family immunity protein n=1 Tax=Chryseobacterium sp. R2A-55 TaxID=2744445 RepID=UPI001F2144C9|nr:Imm63 family immunity protein [Chryseobacterium sp. R2A-55]